MENRYETVFITTPVLSENQMKEAVEKRSDLLFQIKLFPVKQSSLKVAKTIVCSKSMEQLETPFEKKDLEYLAKRQAGGILPRNQEGGDLLIPVWWKDENGHICFGGIVIQLKNCINH